jgi:hypothetical protein
VYGKPLKYRIEHRRHDLAAMIVAFAESPADMVRAFRRQFNRIEETGEDGQLVAIDQYANPERVVRERDVPIPVHPAAGSAKPH